MSKRIEEVLAEEGDAAEAFEEDQTIPYPDHVKITRGNPRSRVLQVRLNEDEYAAIERIAARHELPVSTVARERLLALIAEENGEERPLFALLAATDRLKDLASDLRANLIRYDSAPSAGAFLELAAQTFGFTEEFEVGGNRRGRKFTVTFSGPDSDDEPSDRRPELSDRRLGRRAVVRREKSHPVQS